MKSFLKFFVLFFFMLLFAACSPLYKMRKEVKGLTMDEVVSLYGKPNYKYQNGADCWIFVYDKVKRLKSEPISGGNFHATQISIPSTIRTDHFHIQFNNADIVDKVYVESEYK
ncbi:MAG: hypothetical protein N4A37_00325 [Prolixibacteraceae bacterium]|nr:hypothetical protein [Prolixibacteraceae bacterium]